MNLTGAMPRFGGASSSHHYCNFAPAAASATRRDPMPSANTGAAKKSATTPAAYGQIFLSATRVPLRVGQTVRGADRSENENVDYNFRGTILEFIEPTPQGNNVRVKRNSDGKVFRVKNSEIRGV